MFNGLRLQNVRLFKKYLYIEKILIRLQSGDWCFAKSPLLDVLQVYFSIKDQHQGVFDLSSGDVDKGEMSARIFASNLSEN